MSHCARPDMDRKPRRRVTHDQQDNTPLQISIPGPGRHLSPSSWTGCSTVAKLLDLGQFLIMSFVFWLSGHLYLNWTFWKLVAHIITMLRSTWHALWPCAVHTNSSPKKCRSGEFGCPQTRVRVYLLLARTDIADESCMVCTLIQHCSGDENTRSATQTLQKLCSKSGNNFLNTFQMLSCWHLSFESWVHGFCYFLH